MRMFSQPITLMLNHLAVLEEPKIIYEKGLLVNELLEISVFARAQHTEAKCQLSASMSFSSLVFTGSYKCLKEPNFATIKAVFLQNNEQVS